MNDKYILDGHKPVIEKNLFAWAKWYETANRHVAKTEITKDIFVSTIFLGLDHAYGFDEKPLLFETMIFGGSLDQEMNRYSTWDEAEEGHKDLVEKTKAALAKIEKEKVKK